MSIVGGWLIRTEWDQRDKRFRVLSQIELIHARLKGGTEHHPKPPSKQGSAVAAAVKAAAGFYSPHPRYGATTSRETTDGPNPRLSPQSHQQAQNQAPQTHGTSGKNLTNSLSIQM